MSDSAQVQYARGQMADLEQAFQAFERGDRGRLFDAWPAMGALSSAVKASGCEGAVPVCDIATRLLGRMLRDGPLSEVGVVEVVREILAVVNVELKRAEVEAAPEGAHLLTAPQNKLGEILVRIGRLHPAQIQQALLLQRASKDKRFGEILVAMNAVDQRTLGEALRIQDEESSAKDAIGLEPLPATPPPPGLPGVPRQDVVPPLG